MKSKRTFDRNIFLADNRPPDINLPRGYNLIRFEACPSHRAVPLIPVAPMHVSKLVAGDFGAALCGEEWRVAQDVSYLSDGKSYTFCKKCQRAAKAIEEGSA